MSDSDSQEVVEEVEHDDDSSIKSCDCCPYLPEKEPSITSSESYGHLLKLSGSPILCICTPSESKLGTNKRSSQSTIEFVLDPKAKKHLKKSQITKTQSELETEKAQKYRLFQLECDTKEADKLIAKLLVKRLLLTSKKKRRDADLQRYESKLGDKTIKLNCVTHNWELFEIQEKHRELRSKYIVELAKERHIDKEIKRLSKIVQYLSVLAAKSDNESLDNLDHLRVRLDIQGQLYDQEVDRLEDEKMVLGRDIRLLEESHFKQLTAEKEKLKNLKAEHLKWKQHYLKLLAGQKGSKILKTK